MISLPKSTYYGNRIPKQKFYEKLEASSQLKRIFIDQIKQITWKNKIAPSTINVVPGESVEEIEVFEIELKQQSLDSTVLAQIDKVIPYHILFVLVFEEKEQAWIEFKNSSNTKKRIYYNTDWTDKDSNLLKLEGLSMDAIYEGLVQQISGLELIESSSKDVLDLSVAVEKDQRLKRVENEIATLEKKIANEMQFNRQVEMNQKLKALKEQLSD